IRNTFTDADFALLHELGFTFVRLPINLELLLDESRRDYLNPEHLALLDEAMKLILAHELAIIVDLHSTTLDSTRYPNIFSGRLEAEEGFGDVLEQFWRSFARHLSQYDPEWVFIEPMNEPVYVDDPQAWIPVQKQLLAAVRESAPNHTLIATGAIWSNLDTLLQLEPLDDPNIIYNFHFYEPFLFTHQGADWAGDQAVRLHDIPYPSSPEAVEAVLPQIPGSLQNVVRLYGEEQWNADKILARIGEAAAWAKKHNVRLICNEFGAYSLYASPKDRVQWLYDTRTAFEHYGIGWAMWEYHDTFGLVKRAAGNLIVDWEVAAALGLKTP
ncbi:MAG: glycoside hydrolase family 5 protein, partial [Anaerolineae bacterium]|nr:glycoside hydrolase family 5 protein [Anaerolineae bacterium]